MAARKRRIVGRLRDDTRGSVIIEATLVIPLIVIIFAGMTEWGLAMYQYHLLSTATSESVRQLIVSRGTATPLTYVNNAFNTWASTLGVTPSQVTVEIQDPTKANFAGWQTPACNTLTEAQCAAQIAKAAGLPARVSVNYACTMQFTPQFASLCPIKITMVGLVE
ncbi:TadE/TadG family type IV pilus assembly protein [Aestuariivirga sp.]|uniref:TadE/TadG family type IV pilus assembly protein n=1 Tax=Aestuariivirga sp. TaxID=2650926 RepID=UPI0030164A27